LFVYNSDSLLFTSFLDFSSHSELSEDEKEFMRYDL